MRVAPQLSTGTQCWNGVADTDRRGLHVHRPVRGDPRAVEGNAVYAGEAGVAGRGDATVRSGVDRSVMVLGVSGAVGGGIIKYSEPQVMQ